MLAAIVLLGTAVRVSGFSRLDLFYDDAWAASPSTVKLSTAVHMVVTTPGYTLLLRSWLRLWPGVTPWAQLPAFALSLVGIVAVAALVRRLGGQRWQALTAAAVIALSPVCVNYATHLKSYPFDLLVGVGLLWLTERLRSEVRLGRALAFGVAAAVASLMSGSTIVVVAGCALALCLLALRQASARRALGAALTLAGLGALTCQVLFLSAVPSLLHRNWTRRGYLLDTSSLHGAAHNLVLMFSGIPHNLFGVALVGQSGSRNTSAFADFLALATVGGLAALLFWAGRRSWRAHAGFDVVTPAASVVALALLLGLGGRVPFGDGRTDEAIYPALLVLVLFGVRAAWLALDRSRAERALPSWARLVVAAVIACGALGFGSTHLARYPTIDLRGLAAQLATHRVPGAVTVVDGFNSFGWGLYDLSPTKVQLGTGGAGQWPQGFHIVSTRPQTLIAGTTARSALELAGLSKRTKALWYVGFTLGTFDPYVGLDWVAVETPTTMALRRDGWRVYGFALVARHCYATFWYHR